MEYPRLTQLSHGAGCGCKIAPNVLETLLGGLEKIHHPRLLVGTEHRDDAAVFALNDEDALISTTDFFTPIVDDPYDFGRIAATNAISDIYAMGGRPILGLSILGWPVETLPAEGAAELIRGAQEVCELAGFPLAGGHSIDSKEPIFGLAVNGLIKQSEIKTNAGARAGDLLYLTKPLGVGILATAFKKGQLSTIDYYRLIAVTTELNRIGEQAGSWPFVHAMTDVTGFGLLGHTLEMARAAGLTAKLELAKIPCIDGLQTYLDRMLIPDQVYRNWNSYGDEVQGVQGAEFMYLCDPQTSGGLLISVQEKAARTFEQKMSQANQLCWQIGQFETGEAGCVII
jgi:selenide,water dikinase